jgi:hypothetical protein
MIVFQQRLLAGGLRRALAMYEHTAELCLLSHGRGVNGWAELLITA